MISCSMKTLALFIAAVFAADIALVSFQYQSASTMLYWLSPLVFERRSYMLIVIKSCALIVGNYRNFLWFGSAGDSVLRTHIQPLYCVHHWSSKASNSSVAWCRTLAALQGPW